MAPNLIRVSGEGADYAHHITACPPRFEKLTFNPNIKGHGIIADLVFPSVYV